MTLRAVHSNRAEALVGALLEQLPSPLDPFAPSTIVVGSHLVGRWLRREIALTRGIATGLDILVVDSFLTRAYTSDAAASGAGLTALDRRTLGAVLASVLADPALIAALPAVRAYLDAAPGGADAGDRAGPRRVQLAERLASLYMAYAATRPDWLPALTAGRVPTELEGNDTARWQAALLGAAMQRLRDVAPDRQHAPAPMLPWLRRRAGLATPALPGPAYVFGASYIRRAELDAFADLAMVNDLTIYFANPCEELWDDVGGRRATAGDPLPLTMWGRPARDTLAALIERTGGDLDGRFVEATAPTALGALLGDVLHRRSAPAVAPSVARAGVTVLAAPSVRRELEIVADHARRALDADPTLRAHDIAVWIAGSEPEAYLARAPAAFEATAVPCHLIDAPIDDRGRVGEAVLALLELPTSARTRGDLLRVMTHPAVLARHPHVDPADWIRWTERLGIARGADAQAHAGTYLETLAGHFHWDQGVRRLALGGFMVGERAGRGAARFGDLELLPEELRPDDQASAATYALLVRSLTADAAWLADLELPLAKWGEVLAQLVDAYLAPRDAEATADLERVRGMLAGLAAIDLDGRAVGFREVRAHAQRRLTTERANRGEALAAGVMVAPLAAMRALPFRISFVVGLAAGEFPAADADNPLDLRTTARPGDVSPRERDRYALFESVGCARDALFLSYVAAEPKSGETLGPSSVVLELADALAPYLGASSSDAALAALTERHPLHRFAGSGAPASVVPAAARERWAVNVRGALGEHLRRLGVAVPDEDGMQALLAQLADRPESPGGRLAAALGLSTAPPTAGPPAVRAISITTVRAFLEAPVQAWAQAALGLAELPDDTIIDHDDEPFALEPGDRAQLLREIFAAHLRDPARELAAHYDATVAAPRLRGHYPVGVFGDATRATDLALLARWRAALGPIAADATSRIAFGRAISPAATLHAALDIPLPDGSTARLAGQTELLVKVGARFESVIALTGEAKKTGRHHLRGALDHLVLAAAGLAPAGHVHRLVGGDGDQLRVEHAPWSADDARAYLGGLIGELFGTAHGYLLSFDLLVKALAGKPLTTGRSRDEGWAIGYGPIDRGDGLAVPAGADALARQRLGPLVDRMSGDHGFEVSR